MDTARHGAYFVTGNHEYYSNAHGWIIEVRRLGLTALLNEHVVLQHDEASLLLAGVTDYSAHAAADMGLDLQLSGHTHGGQFFPWNLAVPLQQPFTAGLNRLRLVNASKKIC